MGSCPDTNIDPSISIKTNKKVGTALNFRTRGSSLRLGRVTVLCS